jgi:hypothetical protein
MDIIVPDQYVYHINFLLKLLKIDNIIGINRPINTELSKEIIDYYTSLNLNLPIDNLKNLAITKVSELSDQSDHKTIQETEQDVLIKLGSLNIIPKELSIFGNDLSVNKVVIDWTINKLLNRGSTQKELDFHAINCKETTLLEWLIILHRCTEGINCNLHNLYGLNGLYEKPEEPKEEKVDIKTSRIAIVFCGYARNYDKICEFHKKITNMANTDVFIHTWDTIGLKARDYQTNIWIDASSPKLDIDYMKAFYNPKKMKVENNNEILNTLSLKDKISPIFAFNGQAKDDCSKYINSQLYSIYEGYKLVEEYEEEHNFKYTAIVKLRLDFYMKHFDETLFLNDIQQNVVWFPHASCNNHRHAGGGGGCNTCDRTNAPCQNHTNDICDIWFYGKRDLVQKAFELYLTSYDIMKANHENNLARYKSIRHIQNNNYVYIIDSRDIETAIVCYYPERLLREQLKNILCKSSKNIQGGIFS